MKKILRNCKKMNIGRRVISVLLVIALVLGVLPLDLVAPNISKMITPTVHAAPANSRKANLTYNDLNDFVAYSIEYQSNAELYSEDTITLTINSGEYHTLSENFRSLGTSEWPFNGKIYITASYGDGWYFNTDKPLFDYVTDSVTINYAITDHLTDSVPIEIRRKFVDSTSSVALSPLFANHVKHGTGASATWSVKAAPYVDSQDNVNTYNFSGLIGTMENDAQVSINFVNDSYYSTQDIHSNIQGADDIGLVCGTMNQGSAIDLTLSGTNTYCNIESTSSGNAGGLVGTMNAGSVLTIKNSAYVPDSNRTVKAASGYAGGLVGESNGGLIQFPTPEGGASAVYASIHGTVDGTSGAGGLYGYYSNPVTVDGETQTPQSVTFDLINYDIDCTVKASAAGGLFGVLSSTANITVDGSSTGANEITIIGDSVTNFGGIAGTFQTSALTNSFQVNTVTANTSSSFAEGTSFYGGVCGKIVGNQPAYIGVSSLTHKSSAGYDASTAFGGVVGNAGDKGSMLDIGSVTIETGVVSGTAVNGSAYKGGGIVGILTDGVLRLSGTTDLTKAPSTPAMAKTNETAEYKASGQLVGIRTDSLVYAVGSGNNSGWTFDRSNTQVNADDIGTWGSVIRPDETNLTLANLESRDGAGTGVLDFNATDHTVTVKAPVTTNMSSAADYTRTALNMQLNSGDKGALKFADSSNKKSVLLGTNLSFSGTIELSGTGNIGLMRDDYKDSTDEIGSYTKKISGGAVNLAIGERYGSPSTGIGRGDIVAHRYNGLIARTDTGAEVNGITIGGTINVNATIDGTHIGGAVSDAKKGITLTNVTAQEAINFNKISGSSHIVGGVVADVAGGNTSISGGTAKPTITLTGNIGDIPIGGTIGKITNTDKTITASSLTIAATINASSASGTDVSCVGFISEISGGSMDLTGVTVNGTVINNCASGDKSHSGGFLGMKWLGTDVDFTANNGVILSGTNNSLSTSAKYVAGLVQYATGHWTVPEKGISITGMSITNATNSLGLIVHDGYSGSNGLYLELTHKDSYDLSATGLTIPATTYYDELVAVTGSDVLSNSTDKAGNGVISITTDGDLVMDGTDCNTYQNKYNKGNLSNNKSRYYYNLTSISAKGTKSDGEKLLLWSLNKYAANNINSNFSNAFGTGAISGNFDLEHISYYPIDVDDDLTIGNASSDTTFKFYNANIEASEIGTGNSDAVTTGTTSDGKRTTRGASQHYLMHSGLFRNVKKTLTTVGNIHFKGDIGVDATYSGALINGTLSGTLSTSEEKEIVLEGLTINDNTKYLLINKLTTNSKMTLSGVRTGGGKDFSNTDKSSTETKYTQGATVASSLIGDVSGNGIQIKFSRMKLDSRSTAGSPSDLSAQYGTTKSIFSGATFLNKFAVDNNSTGTYDFAETLDWTSGTHNANVTYGMEIRTSKEYENKQQKYFGNPNDTHYVDPKSDPSSRTAVYPFNSGFLPYVKESTAIRNSSDPSDANYATSQYDTREIKVNVYTEGLSNGCGTYNHPYEIDDGSQLVTLATSINKTDYFSKLRLPKIQGTDYATAISNHWCTTKNTTCAEFDHGSGNYTYTENGTTYTWTEDQVSLYLASAYYIIKDDIEITGTYAGLGASPTGDTTGKYAFRGVIVGAKSDGTTKISMSIPKSNEISNYENTHGLITMSNGCVIKNLTIQVTPYTTDKYNYRVYGNKAYAYNEEFSNYGAVINKIMGGDNIIDNVRVDFTGYFKVRNDNDYKATVGGYVGCVVNGGLIFRNVDDDSLTNFVVKKVDSNGNIQTVTVNKEYDEEITDTETGVVSSVHHTTKTITNLTDEDDLIHIHVNPFVGRVINGYAIRETNTYGFSEDGATYGDGETRANAVKVTMHNTRKNYSIPDIDSTKNYQNDVTNNTTNVLTFTKPQGETSYNTITVPNSQALYIMSIIAQSGSGCASSETAEYAYNISYCGNSNRSYAGTVQQNNKATHWASYDSVGNDTKGDDYNLSKNDTVNSKAAVPYIIYKYTSSYDDSGTKYPARTLTQRTFYVNLVGGTTYYLPDSFRGIGFLGSNTLDDNMKIYGFDGKGTTTNPTVIDVNSEYYLNQRQYDPYFGSNINAEYMVGIGLFNNLKQSSSAGFDSKYESDNKYQITNFTLQGYLSAHHVDDSGADQPASPGDNRDGQSMNTAGLVPTVLSNDVTLYNFSNIQFRGLHINGYAYASGFVAYTNGLSNNNAYGVMIYINNCNADGFKVEGSGRVAGFVGSFDTNRLDTGIHINTGLDSSGNDSFTSVMRNTIIKNRFSGDKKQNYTAGILGSVYSAKSSNTLPSDNGDNARGQLILRNVTIEGGNTETNYIGNRDNPSGSSGGILGGGSGQVYGCLIQNCIVKDIDIYGKYAGGIMGEDANRNSSMGSKTGIRIVGCKVTGKLDNENNPQYTIMGLYYAGGVYGDTRDINTNIHPKYKSVTAGDADYVEYKTDIDGVYIYGYNIYSVNESNKNDAFDTNNSNLKARVAAGGLIGSNNENRTIQNCKVEKCVIDVGTNASSATNTPGGGLIGQLNTGTIYGYNIEIKDCDFYTHQWNKNAAIGEGQTMIEARAINTKKAYGDSAVSGMKCGNFIGNGNSKIVKLTAVHSENNPAPSDFTSINTGSSFIVYADYLDAASGNNHGTSMSTLRSLIHKVTASGTTTTTTYTETGEGGLKDFFPHVSVSPVTKMGSTAFLTSDGAALYSKSGTDTPVVDAIISGGKYTTAGSTVSSAVSAALSENDDANKISTYYTEMGSLPEGVDDFAVVVINTENQTNSTDIINNYIQMVTNTNCSYVKDNNGKYVINVYPCTFDTSTRNYVINADGKVAGLVYSADNYRYYMQNGYADSNQDDNQFSLIDVQFLNPDTTNHANEIVYHLYVPVLTRKMMMFGFKSASLSGTDVIQENFDNYGNTLAESLKSWYTGYVHYTYPISEIQNLLDNGTGLNWNNSKTLQLKYTTEDVSSKLSDDTQIVLVDPYGADKYYYSKLSDLRPANDTNGSVDNLALSAFNSQLDGNGTDFAPTSLLGLMSEQGFTVTAQTGTAGTAGYYYKATTDPDPEKFSITIGETTYEFVGEGNSGNVKLTVNAPANAEMSEGANPEALLKEDYYLCIRAAGNRVYNYSIRTPATISGSTSLRVANLKENEITNIIMGDLYQQTVTIGVQNNGTNNLVIDSTNHQLDVSLRTTITLSGTSGDKDYILQHLSSGNINLYQAFIITLTAQYSTGPRVEILGEPNVTATYTINGSAASPAEGSFNKVTGDFILLNEHDIKSYLSKNGGTIINATVHIDFDEMWKYNQEFPSQDGSDSNIGVNVSAKSNLAYNTSSLVYTNMTASPTSPSNNYYYVKESDGAELVYNFKSGILDEYDEAGYSSFNYSQQGVNPKNFIDQTQTRLPMQTVATFDATSVKKSEFDEAEKIKYTLKLYKKTGAAGSAAYTEVSNIKNYIDLAADDSVFIKVNSGVTSDYAPGSKMTKSGNNELTYTADINQNLFNRQEDQMFDAEIDFTAITGAGFTEYANYRFVLTVDLLDENDSVLNATSSASDWVVYTNAKINPNMLSVTEAGE